jgi:hypothetical protein
MLQAIKYGHLITWPGLTEDAINRHLKLTPATAMGHGPYEPAAPEHTINLEGDHLEATNIGYRLVHKDPPRVRSRSRSGPTLHRLDGKVPGTIQQRKFIRHGLLCL